MRGRFVIMALKGYGKSRLKPNFRHYHTIYRGPKENHEDSGSKLQPPCRDFNPGPPEYEREG
jgi:hypothetical protein